LWSIPELFEQKKRVEKGGTLTNPKKRSNLKKAVKEQLNKTT